MDASSFLNEFEIEREADDIDASHFGAKSKVFLSGPQENTVTLTGHWTGSDSELDDRFDETFGGDADNIVTICPAGVLATAKSCYLTPGTQVSYTTSAEVDAVTEAEAEFRANTVDRAKILSTGAVLQTITGSGTAVITSAATSKGGSAHLHILEGTVGGTTPSVAVKVEHSSDGTTWADLITFAADSVAGTIKPRGERKLTALTTTTVNVQVRANHTITGATSNVRYALAFSRGR